MGEPGGPDDEGDEPSKRANGDVSDDAVSDDVGDATGSTPDDDATVADDAGDDGGDESDPESDDGPRYAPELGDPRDFIDEDDEVPEWVEEAKQNREKNKAARRERGGRYVDSDATDGESTDDADEVDDGAGEADGTSEDDGNVDSEADDSHGDDSLGDDTGADAGAVDDVGADDREVVDGGSVASVDDGLFGGGTAPDDEEMPLTEHVEEMALRIMAVGLVVVGVGAITLFYADDLINFLWYSFIGPGVGQCLDLATMDVLASCPQEIRPRVYHPLALVLARLKVASLVGFVAALPVAVYQTYRFMRPGLYPHERRYYLAAVPTSLVLATVGVGFAYFAVLPAMFQYFTSYSERAADIAFGLTETFNLIVLMLGFFALTFQIPLLVMLAIMMGVTTRQWLADRRLYFWGGFAAVAFLFSPDPTGMAPILVAVTMIALFDGTLVLLRWTDRDSPLFSPAAFADRRPYAWILAVLAGYLASPAPVPGSYYGQFPEVVRETLVYNELVDATPVITAGVLIFLFEAVAFLVRRYSRDVRVWHAVNRSRFPYWMLALVAGYFASPHPPGLQFAQQVALPTTQAVAITAGLVVAYELLILGLRWRRREA